MRADTAVARGAFRAFSCLLVLTGCGRTPIGLGDAAVDAGPRSELCNGRDDDGDGQVDESFRDELGRYVDDEHCGRCDAACDDTLPNAVEVGCGLVQELPACVARRCAPGFGPSIHGSCAEIGATLCLNCQDDGDCGTLAGATCATIGSDLRCSYPCDLGCPPGYVCRGGSNLCAPAGGDCACDVGDATYELACTLPPGNGVDNCVGRALCEDGALSDCVLPDELCDGGDNDCDGQTDEDYVTRYGDGTVAYSTDEHCGMCGIDCASDVGGGVALTCGGDPFAPSCVVLCPDALDGIEPGDRLDADRRIDNGCECVVRSIDDPVGAAAGESQLDDNCDGADGDVLRSFYVATSGDDAGPGSPTRPLRSIGVAVERAANSLSTDLPRPDVYVASGIYTETVTVRDGVRLHGGYRSDFLSLDPDGFEVVVVAPADTTALGGAALVIEAAGLSPTLIEGMSFRGRDADAAGGLAVGVEIIQPAGSLTLRDLRVRTGKPGAGVNGTQGGAGSDPSSSAADGAPQRPAVENASRSCTVGDRNIVRGGPGGRNVCGGIDVSGGQGGSAVCPSFNSASAGGSAGRGAPGTPGGAGGAGSRDLSGPIRAGSSCPVDVCCGLADFTVPGNFTLPESGRPGGDGQSGAAGSSCVEPLGAFNGNLWMASGAGAGSSGRAGSGGGGGGSGGGVEMEWIASSCEWPDGLAGAGGGGGAGGCGGAGGNPGTSGGAAIGIVVHAFREAQLPSLQGVEITTEPGGRGGDGGNGGDGGQGGSGGFGGRVPDAERSTPPLAGPLPGERGGKGGNGGAGGGGGAGCGGSSIGIWISGLGVRVDLEGSYARDANTFSLAPAGAAGRGGGGAVPATDGVEGRVQEVVTR